MTASSPREMSHTHLDDPSLRGALRAMVRQRVPAADVDDVVQSTLADAVAAPERPEDREQLRRWVFGIARHKIVDAHRARRREVLEEHELEVASTAAMADDEAEAAALLRWAERELPSGAEARSTLGLMLREGEGERLEHLAADAQLPAATLRQRVHRLRRHFRARWGLQVAVAIALVLGGLVLYSVLAERREIAIHPIVGVAPSTSMGGPSPSASIVAPPSSPTASTSATTVPSSKGSAERPAPAPKKMTAPERPVREAPAPPAPRQKANDAKTEKPAPGPAKAKEEAELPNAPPDADAQAAGPKKPGSKRAPPPTMGKMGQSK